MDKSTGPITDAAQTLAQTILPGRNSVSKETNNLTTNWLSKFIDRPIHREEIID